MNTSAEQQKREILSTILALCGLIAIFAVGSYLRLSGGGIRWPGYDASEYHYVAKNIALLGRGLKVSVVSQFYPRPSEVEHQIVPFHQPLNYYILAASYYIFGEHSGTRAAALILDFALTLCVFFIAKKITSGDILVAFFSAAIFCLHPASLNARFSGGAAAGFAMFFGFLFVWFSYRASEEPKNFIAAGLCGAFAYLIRNEGIFTLPALFAVWFFSKDRKKSFYHFAVGAGIIMMAFIVWEIRNYSIYGTMAATSRLNMMFGRDYYDMWRYYPEPSGGLSAFVKEYLRIGLSRIVITKIQSYHYKILWAMDAVGFPLALFLINGFSSRIFNRRFLIAPFVYFVGSYLFFGFFNAHSQQWGWYAAEVFVPLWSAVAVVGCFHLPFDSQRFRRIVGITLASGLLLFYLSDVAKVYFKNKKISLDPVAELSQKFNDFRLKKDKSAIFMTHIPFIFACYYPDVKMVQIPTNEPLDVIEEVIEKYKCDYLMLYGVVPSAYPFAFKDMYEKNISIKGFSEVFSIPNPSGLTLEGAGPWFKIYKIEKDKLSVRRR